MSEPLRLKPKSWREFQHYKNRFPPWIRLHRSLLDNYEFQCLPVASKALAPMLWLIASEFPDGIFAADVPRLSFRLRVTECDLIDALTPLIDNGFFEVVSGVLAGCLHDAVPETETETETENTPVVPLPDDRKRRRRLPDDFSLTVERRQAATKYWLAKGRRDLNPEDQFAKFRSHHVGKGTRMLDWDSVWQTWYSNAIEFTRAPAGPQLAEAGGVAQWGK